MNQDADAKVKQRDPKTGPSGKPKLPASVHFMCGWPLLLVAAGGAIGGGLGGAAYAVNLGIYRSNLPVAAKVLLNVLAGFAAIGIWLAIAVAIQSARQ